MAGLKVSFPAQYKGPFEKVKARIGFGTLLAARGTGLSIVGLVGDANWIELEDPANLPAQWGDGTPGRTDAGAIKVSSPYEAFLVETSAFVPATDYVDLTLSGGEMGKTYLITVAVELSNGEKIYRSAAISIAQL